MAAFTDANVLAVLKECYQEKDVHNTLFRNSPALAKVKKDRASGKYYVVPMLYSRGGCVTGDFSTISTLIAQRAKNVAMQVDYGQIFSGFAISPKEVNASDLDEGSFVSLIREFFFASNEALRKTAAAAFYGSGFGEVALLTAVDGTSQLYFDCKQWGAMGLDIGSQVVFATGPQPSGALRSASAVEITGITDLGTGSVRVTVGSAYSATVAIGDWVCIAGFRSGSTPLCFRGLRAWLPTVGNRTGGTWTSYIGATFFNVNRSVYPSRLAGEFILRDTGNNETRSNAILRGVRAVRRNGGVPDMIVMNDVDYAEVLKEIDAYKQYFQQINGPQKADRVELVRGISAMMFAFSSTWLEYVMDDPYCPEGYSYILESDSIGLKLLSSAKEIDKGSVMPTNNEPGSPKVASQSEPPEQYAFNIEDYIATAPSDSVDGQGTRVTTQLFAAFIVRNPAHNCVVKHDSTLP